MAIFVIGVFNGCGYTETKFGSKEIFDGILE